ncbi:MAG: hypothetical protein AB1560_13470, partial [Pseudomonadota bacterium]
MALRIEKTGRRVEYILHADRESSAPTKFILRPLTWEEESEAEEHKPNIAMTTEQAVQINEIRAKAREEGRDDDNLTIEELQRIGQIAPGDPANEKIITRQHAVRCRYGIVEIQNLLDTDDKPLALSGAEFARRAP